MASKATLVRRELGYLREYHAAYDRGAYHAAYRAIHLAFLTNQKIKQLEALDAAANSGGAGEDAEARPPTHQP